MKQQISNHQKIKKENKAMSRLCKLTNDQFIELIRNQPDKIPFFVDEKTRKNWKTLISLYIDNKAIFNALSLVDEWKEQAIIIQNILNKNKTNELCQIHKQYKESYNKYLSYWWGECKNLRYLLYTFDLEDEFEKVFKMQRQDTTLKDLPNSQDMEILPGNPYLYACSSFDTNTKPSKFHFLHDYRLEGFLDVKINLETFNLQRYIYNPVYGKFMGNKWQLVESELLYIILKAWDLEQIYFDAEKNGKFKTDYDSDAEQEDQEDI